MNIEKSNQTEISRVFLEIRTVIFSLQDNSLQILLLPEEESTPLKTWNLPGKHICDGSSLEKSSSHLIHYYTGVQETYQEQLYTYENLLTFPNLHLISVAYFALIPLEQSPKNGVEPDQARWFPIHSLPQIVNNYNIIIPYALRRLRYKLEYSAAGFELLPEDFSLSQLQKTYEIILDEKLDKRNFRRRILEADIIEPTPHLKTGEGRPARLFRYKPDAVAEVKTRRLFP